MNNIIKIFLFIFILGIFLFPGIKFINAFPSLSIDDLILPFLLIFVLIKFKIDYKIKNYLTILVFILFSISISLLFNINKNNINDLFEIYKLLKHMIIFLFFYLYYDEKFTYYQLSKIIKISFVLVVVFNLLHLLNLFNFNEIIMKFYAGDELYKTLLSEISMFNKIKRLYGTMGNPNNNSILFSFFLIYFYSLFQIRKSLTNLFFIFVSFLLFLLSNSRTTFLALILAFSFYFFIIKKDFKLKIAFIFILFFIFILLLYTDYFLYLKSLVTIDLKSTGSYKKRIEIWVHLLNLIKDSPIIGFGPNKNYFYEDNIYSENGYILYLYRYGFIGLFINILLILYPIYLSLKNRKGNLYIILLLFYIVLLFTSLTNNPTFNNKINCIIALLNGIFFKNLRIEKRQMELKNEKITSY